MSRMIAGPDWEPGDPLYEPQHGFAGGFHNTPTTDMRCQMRWSKSQHDFGPWSWLEIPETDTADESAA